MNPKIYKHLGGTITPWQEHKSSQTVVCNFQLFQCSFGTIKPHNNNNNNGEYICIGAQLRLEQYVLNKKHFTSTEHLENFLNNRFTLAYNFLICLFKSTSELFVENVMPRYLHWSTYSWNFHQI